MVDACRINIPEFQKELYRVVGRGEDKITMGTAGGNFSPAILPLLQIICNENGQIDPSGWMKKRSLVNGQTKLNKIRTNKIYKKSCELLTIYFEQFKSDRDLDLLTDEAVWNQLKRDKKLQAMFLKRWLKYYFGARGLPEGGKKLGDACSVSRATNGGVKVKAGVIVVRAEVNDENIQRTQVA